LAQLSFESCLLAFDPTQLADYCQTNRFVAHPERHGNANTTVWRIHPEVKVLYVLPHNLDRKA
jgi:hypothetical protein